MLESLGQHLGVAHPGAGRLASRDRELAIAEERNMLAQELHDSIAQALAFLNLQTQMLTSGCASTRERAARIGGKFAVCPQPGGGTEVSLHLPLMQREAA